MPDRRTFLAAAGSAAAGLTTIGTATACGDGDIHVQDAAGDDCDDHDHAHTHAHDHAFTGRITLWATGPGGVAELRADAIRDAVASGAPTTQRVVLDARNRGEPAVGMHKSFVYAGDLRLSLSGGWRVGDIDQERVDA